MQTIKSSLVKLITPMLIGLTAITTGCATTDHSKEFDISSKLMPSEKPMEIGISYGFDKNGRLSCLTQSFTAESNATTHRYSSTTFQIDPETKKVGQYPIIVSETLVYETTTEDGKDQITCIEKTTYDCGNKTLESVQDMPPSLSDFHPDGHPDVVHMKRRSFLTNQPDENIDPIPLPYRKPLSDNHPMTSSKAKK